jgi:hypothetical protein
MSVAIARGVLLWCTVINFGVLALWGLLMLTPHGWLHRLFARWFLISPEQFDTISFAVMLLYKVLVFVFNLVPFVALLIAG